MRATEINAVNEWNEGAPSPNWYRENLSQTLALDPDEDPFSDPPSPIMSAEENSAPSARLNGQILD
jgi:hypothetical protein